MDNFKKDFGTFIDSCDGISLYFLDQGNDIYDSDVDAKVLAGFKAKFCDDLRTKYSENSDFSVIGLSDYDGRGSALYKYDFTDDEKPIEFSFTSKVLSFKATDIISVYEAKSSGLSNIKAAIVLLRSSKLNKSISFFQYVFPVSILGHDKGVLNLTTHATRLVALSEDVLKLNTKFTFCQIGSEFYIENVDVLEKRLNFKSVIYARAKTYSVKISEKNIIEDMSKFNERVDKDISFARKVVKAYKNSVVINSCVPNNDIIAFVKSKTYYSKLKISEDGTKFKIDTVDSCRKFLELLDDDFLKSELTQRNYISRSKDLV